MKFDLPRPDSHQAWIERQARTDRAILKTQLLLVAVAWILALLFGGCAHVCARTWEAGAEYTDSPYFGPGYSTRLSVGGGLAKECREDK